MRLGGVFFTCPRDGVAFLCYIRMSEKYYKADYKVRIADADSRGLLKFPALLQMLQEIATEHAQMLGVDYSSLAAEGLGWALSKIIVNIDELPKWGERVFIETWASARDRIVTYREFVARDKDGRRLFTARSQWLVFDLKERRIARMSRVKDWPRDEENFANGETFDAPFEKVETADRIVENHARNDDIDLNAHVNNSVFLIWALDSVPDEFQRDRLPERLKISFLKEVLPQNIISSQCQLSGDRSIHSLVNKSDGSECARINIDWKQLA